ncbi:MAG: ferritin-like domain-containing protein [Clostridiales bacterium]|nr:ferritin-like domain-containing protein [Clostridiales bacterium]MCF8023705.1 ferritin-like domain-containing protein [Clostridiales bacterium]
MAEQNHIDTMNELLKGEYMAMQIYEKTRGIQGDTQVTNMLDSFAKDHKRHAEQLTQRIIELGGTPVTGTGFSGVMAGASAVFNSIRGPKHLLQQLYDGEDKGIHAYEDRIDELDSVTRGMIKNIMQEDHEHLKQFKARMEKEKME